VRSLAEEVMGGFFETFPRLTFTGCDLTNADPQIVNKLIEAARELIFESCKVQLRLEAWTPQFDRCQTLTLIKSKLLACDYDKKASNVFPSLKNLRIDSCSVVKAPNILPLVDFETLDTLWVACGDKESGRQLLTKIKSHVYSLKALKELHLAFRKSSTENPQKVGGVGRKPKPPTHEDFDSDFIEMVKYTISRLKSYPKLFLVFEADWKLSDLVRMALFIRGKHVDFDCGPTGKLTLDTQIFNTKTVYSSPTIVRMKNFVIGQTLIFRAASGIVLPDN
jgi:hypothetical protein